MSSLSDYQHEIERKYEPKKWQAIPDIPPGTKGLTLMELYPYCNSSSMRFQDLLHREVGETAILLDHELLHLGLDPNCGCTLAKSPGGKIILTVFTEDGNKHYIEVPS